jgi:hypothetical protein
MAESHPVYVQVKRADGSMENVRVGSALREGDDFVLSLGELRIGGTPEARRAPAAAMSSGGGEGGEVFPPYGRSKGAPVRGATMGDLEYYASGSRRSLGDPSKARWHDKERVLLAAIEAEIERQGGSPGGSGGSSYGGAAQGGYAPTSRSSSPAPAFDDEAPPPGDDDIPF